MCQRSVALAFFFAACHLAFGQYSRLINGKVVMEDGAPPPKGVRIERTCGGRVPVHIASTNSKGEFSWSEAGETWSAGECIWRAVLAGYDSTILDMATIQMSGNVPDFVLHRAGATVPAEAATRWNRATQAVNDQRWTDAETDLRALSTQFPQNAPIWTQLGLALARQERLPEARQAYQRAIQAVPWFMNAYHLLATLDFDAKDYEAASKTVEAGLKKGTSALLHLDRAAILYNQHRDEEAAHSALQAIALDTKHELPRAEYVLGLVLSGGEDKLSAAAHLRRFLEVAPNAPEAESARERLRSLESGAPGVAQEPLAPEVASADPDLEPDANGEVGIPGGLRGLAAAARMKRTPAAHDFFLEYCRTIAREAQDPGHSDIPDFAEAIQAYLAAVLELTGRGTRARWQYEQGPASNAVASLRRNAGEADSPQAAIQIVLSTDTAEHYSATSDLLKLFGWRPSPKGVAGFEPSELAEDSARQLIPTALGIDETEMFQSLSDGGAFRIEIRNSRAPLVEAKAWRSLMGKLPPGGFAEAFLRNPRFALTYVGLASMNTEAAAAVMSGIGLRALVTRYAEAVATFGEAFAVVNGRASVPGGAAAEPVWQRLAGASPADPKAFFRALLDKDQGRLTFFYWAVWRGDEAHQRFFTREGAAARFYDWYRNSPELRDRVTQARASWRQQLFRDLPLDDAGNPYFPGGRTLWLDASRAEDEALLAAPTLEALAPVAALERARKAPLDSESARLLARHFSSWRSLFLYFSELPALGAAEFQALAAFETSVEARPAAVQNTVMGEWHALVKLIELGTRSGSLDSAAGARAFRTACESLAAPDHAAGAIAALRSFAPGSNDLEEAVRTGLLRLDNQRRDSYRQVREIQGAPALSAPGLTGGAVLDALSGAVYAALLDPHLLLVMEDPGLPARHKFTLSPRGPAVFAPTNLSLRHEDPGTYFAGGYMTFEDAAKDLARSGTPTPIAGNETAAAAPAPTPPTPEPGPAAPFGETVFRANARVVEIYATVTDPSGRYADDLKQEDFRVVDAGTPVEIRAFEDHTAAVSVALLLDTTGSMVSTLPALRSAALRLIDDLRPADSVAVYSFNSQVSDLQPFTRHRGLAKRSVLRTHAAGATGLYEALVRVARDLSGVSGKKAIVVFTDGEDNASALTAAAAVNRAKREGVPIYTVAQGGALRDWRTVELAGVAATTGGLSFQIRRPEEIRGVFDEISRDLQHGYLLAFQPPPDTLHKWRAVQVTLPRIENRSVRARQGYYPD